MQILHGGNICVGPSFWFHMIKLFDTKYNCIFNKTCSAYDPFLMCAVFLCKEVRSWCVCLT